jgi:hypothetical protein
MHGLFLPCCLSFIVILVGTYRALFILLVLLCSHTQHNTTRDEADDESRLRPGMR